MTIHVNWFRNLRKTNILITICANDFRIQSVRNNTANVSVCVCVCDRFIVALCRFLVTAMS